LDTQWPKRSRLIPARIERTAQLLTWGADEHILCALAAVGGCSAAPKALQNGTRATTSCETLVASALPHILKAYLTKSVRIERRSGPLARYPVFGQALDAFRRHAVHIGLSLGRQRASAKQRNLAWGLGGALVLTRIVLLAHWFSDVARLAWQCHRAPDQAADGYGDREKRRIVRNDEQKRSNFERFCSYSAPIRRFSRSAITVSC